MTNSVTTKVVICVENTGSFIVFGKGFAGQVNTGILDYTAACCRTEDFKEQGLK